MKLERRIAEVLNPRLGIETREDYRDYIASLGAELDAGNVEVFVRPDYSSGQQRIVVGVVDTENAEETELTRPFLAPSDSKGLDSVVNNIQKMFNLGDGGESGFGSIVADRIRQTLDNDIGLEDAPEGDETLVGEVLSRSGFGNGGAAEITADRLKSDLKLSLAPLSWIDKLIVETGKTINLASDPDVKKKVKQLALEQIELVHTIASARNSEVNSALVLKMSEHAKKVLSDMGIQTDSLMAFLQVGLDRLKTMDPSIPSDLTVAEPMGFNLALLNVLVPQILAPIQAVPVLAGEVADGLVDKEMARLESELEILKEQLDQKLSIEKEDSRETVGKKESDVRRELAIYDTHNKELVAKETDKSKEVIISGREADIRIASVEKQAKGRSVAATLKGMGYVPLSPVEGLMDSIADFVKEKPLEAVGLLVAAGELIVPLATNGLLTDADIAVAVIVFLSSPVLQALFDKALKPGFTAGIKEVKRLYNERVSKNDD